MTNIPEQTPGPTEFHNPDVRREIARAVTWLAVGLVFALIILLIEPLLLFVGAVVFATLLDGGVRLMGRVLPIKRIFRLIILCLLTVTFLVWVVYLTGSQLAAQAVELQKVLTAQFDAILAWVGGMGLDTSKGIEDYANTETIFQNLAGALGTVTQAAGVVAGGVVSAVLIAILGLFIAIEPSFYSRGVAWMLPSNSREHFYDTTAAIGKTLRRLLAGRLSAMVFEGIGTWILLSIFGVPMAALLGLLTGMLAFIPNVGALMSGSVLVLAGFSAGVETGLYAIGVYLFVHTLNGYIIVPTVMRRTVNVPAALVLGAQIMLGTLFGIIGLALADPLVVMIKVWLEKTAERKAKIAQAIADAQANAKAT